jgi:SAM-dependent methyltransferase
MNNSDAPSPALFFDTINAYQRSAALQAALKLGLFTAIGGTPATASEIAHRCGANDRGTRILADYLTIIGFLTKDGDRYSLTPSTALFLDRNSPAYAGTAADFLAMPELVRCFDSLTDAVRRGGTADSALGTIAPEHPIWMQFARGMAPLMVVGANGLADLLPLDQSRETKVLDISASHGVYGITFAQRNPRAQVTALDWAPVLEVARNNAQSAGVADRFHTIAGSAFEVDLGADSDVVLVPNFLHHFPASACTAFLRKVRSALRPGGRVGIVEFVPNPDRVTPPPAATFALVMLATTPAGDAYTFAELTAMLNDAGFIDATAHPLPGLPATAVLGTA